MIEVILPKTGLYMDDVHLIEWLVEEGAHVEEGDPVFRMETDKVEQDVPADGSGWLHRIVAAGQDYRIGTQIGLIAPTREDYQAILGGTGSPP